MRKYQSIKRIDLINRQSIYNRQTKHSNSRLHSQTQSSQRSITRENGNELAQCLTDRIRNTKINQFSVTPSSASLAVTNESLGLNNSIKSNIKTYIRFKPFTKNELMDQEVANSNCIGIQVINDKQLSIEQNYCYNYDKIFSPDASQRFVYQSTSKQIVTSFVNGYNCTIFAYGQTGSGKTYTMFGQEQQIGIIPQTIHDLFTQLQTQKVQGLIKNAQISCSMLEIYKENICDLLSDKQKDIKIKENANGKVQIQNLTLKQISTKEQILASINRGSDLRKTRETQMNERSSRSHLIFTLYLSTKVNQLQTRVSKLNLVDLAGSQKVSKTKVSGQGLQEAIKINLSLSCLGNTINALCRGQQHIPYRDSKLTRVLQESLSGNSITRVIVTCSILPSCKEQTISSLKFANRIKTLKTLGFQNVKKLNQNGFNKFMYQTLKISYQSCEDKLEKIKQIVGSSSLKMSKEDIIQSIKFILNQDSKNQQQNQFLPYTQTLQGFKSPSKQQNVTNQFYEHFSETHQKIHEINITNQFDLADQIKNLQSIVLKQQNIIQDQIEQLQKLKMQISSISLNKNDNQNKRRAHKLKILKTNSNRINSDLLYEIKNKKQSQQKQNMMTFPNKFLKNDKNDLSFLGLTGELLCQFTKQKLSYETMQKQILSQQVKVLVIEVNQLRKMLHQSGNAEKIAKMQNFSAQMLVQKNKQQQTNLKKNLDQKELYIRKLQEIIYQKVRPLEVLSQIKKNTTISQSLDNKHFIKNQSLKKNIHLLVSTASSPTMTRINSVKLLNKM